MNNSIKNKINTAGTIGYIISIILIVVMIASTVVSFIGAVAAGIVVKGNVDVTVSTNIDVESSQNLFENLKLFIDLDGYEDIQELINNGELGTVSINDSELSEVSINSIENGLSLSAKTNSVTFNAKRLIVALIFTFLSLVALTVMFFMVKALMKALKECDTPFTENVIKRMQRFAVSLIPVVVISMICEGVWGFLASDGNALEISPNLSIVLIIAVVYVLTLVFRYGAELQKQSDETL